MRSATALRLSDLETKVVEDGKAAEEALEWQSATDIWGTSFPDSVVCQPIGQYWMCMDFPSLTHVSLVQNEVQHPPQTDDFLVQHDGLTWPVLPLKPRRATLALQFLSPQVVKAQIFWMILWMPMSWKWLFWRLHWFYGWFHVWLLSSMQYGFMHVIQIASCFSRFSTAGKAEQLGNHSCVNEQAIICSPLNGAYDTGVDCY